MKTQAHNMRPWRYVALQATVLIGVIVWGSGGFAQLNPPSRPEKPKPLEFAFPVETRVEAPRPQWSDLQPEEIFEILQASTPSKGNLRGIEGIVARAMEIDPRIVAARAELEAAQAKLERTRIEVTRQIIDSRTRWEIANRLVERLDSEIKKNPKDEGLIRRYIDARAQLAQIEANMPLLSAPIGTPEMETPIEKLQVVPLPDLSAPVGTPEMATAGVPILAPDRPSLPRTPVLPPVSTVISATSNIPGAEQKAAIAKALDTPVDADFNEQPLDNVLTYFSDRCKVQFILAPENVPSILTMGGGAGGPGGGEGKSKAIADMPVTLHLKGVPLSAVLQAIEDTCDPVRFVVRPYGILVTTSWRTDGRGRGR